MSVIWFYESSDWLFMAYSHAGIFLCIHVKFHVARQLASALNFILIALYLMDLGYIILSASYLEFFAWVSR